MKRFFVTAAIILLLGSAGIGYAVQANSGKELTIVENDQPINEETVENNVEESMELETEETANIELYQADTNDFVEYDLIASKVDMDQHEPNIVEDNKRKRVILWKDSNNREQYKSVYVKKKDRLKVIDFNGGLVINQVIEEPAVEKEAKKEATTQQQTGIEGVSEYGTIVSQIDMTTLRGQVVEDNPYKRIIILKDENNNKQYKSIFVKKTNRLKLIDLHGGLIYNKSI